MGPLALLIAAMYLALDFDPSGSPVVLYGTAAGLAASICLAWAALWLFLNGRGKTVWRRLVWAGWAVVAAGLVLGLFEAPVTSSWLISAAMLESARLMWTSRDRFFRRSALSCLVIIAAALLLEWLDLMGGMVILLAAVMVPALEVGMVCQWWFYLVAARLDEARGLAGELAVAEERLRFAAELHDIQGGHLQVIILKSQLARRLARNDPDRAEAELEAVEELARQALQDTRAVVAGYRKVSLAEEIDSAARVLRSAGIEAAVRTESRSFDERTERLLGLLVREATTNILRHANASEAELVVGVEDQLVVTKVSNDGVEDLEGSAGNGITMLTERFEEAGGTVERSRSGGMFILTGTLPLRIEEAA